MKVYAYDFDETIYDGDSSVDFYKFCLKKKKSICKYWFKQLWALILYILGIKTKTEMKEVFFIYLKDFDNIDILIDEFWNENFKKIKKWYLEKDHSQDIIISASPEFLLENPCKKLKVFALIGSDVDKSNGKFLSLNCHDEEKVKRLKEKYQNVLVLEMYSDSMSDLPMLKLAKHGYLVKKNEIISYEEYNSSLIEKLKHTFLTPTFLRFIFVGCLNTFNGVLFSFLYSLIISNATIAFVIGYINSLVFSYLLNSFITFKDKNLSFKKFIGLCVSYIPNFLIQLVCVYVFTEVLGWYKLWAYIIAAIIGIPITYIFLSIIPFKKVKKN